MDPRPSPWSRPFFEPQGGVSSVAFFVFAERPLDLGLPVRRARHGLPAEFDFATLDIRQHLRSEAPDWFDGFFTREMRAFAESDLGEATARFDEMKAAYSVRSSIEEPLDLGYLQGCWGAAAWLCECGGALLHDAAPIRWHRAEDVLGLDPLREFELEREVTVVFETDFTPGFGNVTHTRGLAKFGRPDVVLFGAEPEDAPKTGVLLNGLARRAALGAALRANQTVRPGNLEPRRLMPYEPELAHPQVHLNNDGLVLDITGWGLREAQS
jgi:hypothetical protein